MLKKMQGIMAKIPLSLTAVGLGLTTIGTAWSQYTGVLPGIVFNGNWVPYLTVSIAIIFWLLAALKVVTNLPWFRHEMRNPATNSHLPVIFMLTMAIGEFSIGQSHDRNGAYYFGLVLWFIGLIFQLIYAAWWLFTLPTWFKMIDVDAAWYIPIVGIPVACAILPAQIGLEYTTLLQILWYLSFIGFLILTVLILYRYLFVSPIHTKELPAIGIIAAPASLLLVTYYFSFISVNNDGKGSTINNGANEAFMFLLAGMAITFTFIALISIIKIAQLKFDPGFAAYSFPLAIGPVARIVFGEWLKTNQIVEPNFLLAMNIEAFVELIISSIVMIYLLIQFSLYIWKQFQQSENNKITAKTL